MPSMSRERFLKEYVLALEKEFELDGSAAAWASPEGPLKWGQEHNSMDLVQSDIRARNDYPRATIALSPDNAYLAVATSSVIRIYTAGEKKIRAELVGHSDDIGRLIFVDPSNVEDAPKGTKYMILSSGRDTIIAWYLDTDGKSLTRTMPFAVDALADQAMSAIYEDLTTHHELDTDARAEIRAGFATTLSKGDMKNRLRGLNYWKGKFGSFESKPINADGTKWLSLQNNETTQGGQREPKLMPTVVVRDFQDSDNVTYLRGYKDAIMCASFSPTDPDILATASWDSTYRIWSVSKGIELHHLCPKEGVQNWSLEFSPDGRHVLFAGTNNFAIYSVETGQQTHALEREGLKLEAWIRYFSWSPSGDAIVLDNGISVLMWRPFDNDRVDEILKFRIDEPLYRGFVAPSHINWLDDCGQLLAIGDGENSYFVWDRKRHVKWRFERPFGKELQRGIWSSESVYDSSRDMLMTLHGDWKIREWKLE